MGEAIYRVPAPKPPVPPDPYLLAWASLRRRRVTSWITLFAWVLMCVGVPRLFGALWILVAFADLTVLFVSSLMAHHFRCPHCRERFATKSENSGYEMFVRCCVHCGISVGTPRSAIVDGNGGLTARGHDEDVAIVESVEDPDVAAGHAPHVRHPR